MTDDRFEYWGNDGRMLITVAAYVGEAINWRELGRILQALWRYMTGGVGAQRTHYQALEFEIQVPGEGRIGIGLVRYFSRVSSQQ